MTKSIVPNKEVFQWAIRHLPTGKYLKKTPGHSFYTTDIPSVYNSPKVAMKSLENESKWNHLCKPEDCQIVKFRLIMEEVKEPTAEEIEFQKELKSINSLRKVLGETRLEEIGSSQQKCEMFRVIKHLDNMPVSTGSSLHCYDEVYKTRHGTFQLIWEHGQDTNECPISISQIIDYNWDDKIQELKLKYGIR